MESTGTQTRTKHTYIRTMSHFWMWKKTKETGFYCLKNYFTRHTHAVATRHTGKHNTHWKHLNKHPWSGLHVFLWSIPNIVTLFFCHKDTVQKTSRNKRVWHVSAWFWRSCFLLMLSSDATYLPAHSQAYLTHLGRRPWIAALQWNTAQFPFVSW